MANAKTGPAQKVELPDGRILEFPQGTDKATMKTAITKFLSNGTSKALSSIDGHTNATDIAEQNMRVAGVNMDPKLPEGMFLNPNNGQMTSRELLKNSMNMDGGAPSNGESIGMGAAHGAVLGLGDEIAGLGARLGGASDGGNFVRELMRANMERQGDENPIAYTGGQVAGSVVTGGAVGAPLLTGKAGLKLAATASGVGAVEGGVIGFNEGEDGFAGRAANAGPSALVGGVGGAVAPGIANLGGKAARAVSNPILGVFDAMTGRASGKRASRAISRGIERSGETFETLQRKMSQAASEGQGNFTLADAMGNPGQRMLTGVARQPGDYRKEIVDFLDQRQIDQGDRLGGFIARNLDATDTATGRIAQMTAQRGADANVNYDAARGSAAAVDVRGALGVIDQRIGGMQGSGVSGDGIDTKLAGYRGRLASDGAGFGDDVTGVELSDFDRVLGVKQAVQDDIGAATRAGRNNEARELGKLVSELDNALEGSSQGYRAASDTFRTQSREIYAVETGKGFTRSGSRAGDNVATFQGMTPNEQDAARVGYADPILAKIENAAEGANKARPLTSTKSQEELGAMANNPQLLQRQIGRENTMFETRAQAIGGSRTADNLADMDDVNGSNVGIFTNLMSGRYGAAAVNAGQRAGSMATGQNEATRALLARALMSKDGPKALAGPIRQSQKDVSQRRMVEALMRHVAVQSAN
ncbi:MAG: hypothetical protein ABJ327_17915 [Litoreibacter sp.]